MELKKFYQGKTVFVTGHTGFKGSWLSLWLSMMGAKVVGYALPPLTEKDHFNLLGLPCTIKHIEGDILNLDFLRACVQEAQPDMVFHLAAQALVRDSYDHPKLTFDTNVTGSVNVLEAVRFQPSVRSLVYVTSDKCYKNKEWIWGYRENDELGGHDPYSASKAAAELVFSSYCDSFFSKNSQIGIGSVRAGNVIGGGDWAKDRIIPDLIRSIDEGSPLEIRNPVSTRPWQHVLEPLSGYLLLGMRLFEKPEKYTGAWNFGPSDASIKTVRFLIEKAITLYGKGRINIGQSDKTKHEAGLLHLNCDKAAHLLNWSPVWDFDQTLQHTIEWYKNYNNGQDALTLTKADIKKFMEGTMQ